MTGVLIKKRIWTKRQTGIEEKQCKGTPCKEGRLGDAATSQGMPEIASRPPEAIKRQGIFS